ncbi:hypothetical protein GCM10023185_08080 [Hymenobacter saemangeumensis]|uniref:Uncharacterized protein n=1 Tax=Hymenobacter saemangeumensis TaxID=1084522 RepID=A0ABP8I3R9_9BACT
MAYSLSLLTTYAQCDAVLAAANKKLGTLSFRDTTTDRSVGNTTETATSISNELSSLNTYLTAMAPALASLPAGRERDELGDELRIKTDRRDALLSRQRRVGPEKLVERELEQALLTPQLPLVQDLIAQITAHRATLAG